MSIWVGIGCSNCRRCKPSQMDMWVCKYKDSPFYPLHEKYPCEHWLPSKVDLRTWIMRAKC